MYPEVNKEERKVAKPDKVLKYGTAGERSTLRLYASKRLLLYCTCVRLVYSFLCSLASRVLGCTTTLHGDFTSVKYNAAHADSSGAQNRQTDLGQTDFCTVTQVSWVVLMRVQVRGVQRRCRPSRYSTALLLPCFKLIVQLIPRCVRALRTPLRVALILAGYTLRVLIISRWLIGLS